MRNSTTLYRDIAILRARNRYDPERPSIYRLDVTCPLQRQIVGVWSQKLLGYICMTRTETDKHAWQLTYGRFPRGRRLDAQITALAKSA